MATPSIGGGEGSSTSLQGGSSEASLASTLGDLVGDTGVSYSFGAVGGQNRGASLGEIALASLRRDQGAAGWSLPVKIGAAITAVLLIGGVAYGVAK